MIRKFFAVVLSFLSLLSIAFAQDATDIQDLVQMLENSEKQVGHISFEQRTYNTSAAEADGAWIVAPPKLKTFDSKDIGVYSSRTLVEYDPKSQRFLIVERSSEKAALKADGSKNDKYFLDSKQSRYCSDSEIFQMEVIGERHKNPPQRLSPNGDAEWEKGNAFRTENYGILAYWNDHARHIGGGTKSALDKFSNSWGLSRIGCMAWTDFETAITLSKYLRKKIAMGENISFRQINGDIVEIFCPIHKSHSHQYSVKFFYDTIKSRIDRVEWGGCVKCAELSADDWWADRIGIFTYDDNSVIPKEVVQITRPAIAKFYSPGDKCEALLFVLENRSISKEARPSEDFTFTFTPGIELSDYIEERVYVVGQGVQNDIAEAEKFMQLNGLTAQSTVSPRKIPVTVWVIISLLLVLLAAVVIRNRIFILFVPIIALLFSSDPILAQDPAPALANAVSKQEQFPQRAMPESRQCGHLVVAATCSYFNCKTDQEIVEGLMLATNRGTSLLQIKQTLEAHGLLVLPKTCSTVSDVTRFVTSGSVVIVPIVAESGRGHFVLIVPGENREDEPLLVDVLLGVVRLSESRLSNELLANVNGAILLVKQRNISNAVGLEVRNPIVELGDLIIDDANENILDLDIRIKNLSDTTVFVTFQTSCNCIQPKAPHVLISGKSESSAKFFLMRSSWGEGNAERFIDIAPKNMKATRVVIRGRGVHKDPSNQRITLTTKQLLVETNPYRSQEMVKLPFSFIDIFGPRELLSSIVVQEPGNWITIMKQLDDTPSNNPIGRVRLTCKYHMTDELFRSLKTSDRQLSAKILLRTSRSEVPEQVTITIVRPLTVECLFESFALSSEGGLLTARFKSEFPHDEIALISATVVGHSDSALQINPTDVDNVFQIVVPKYFLTNGSCVLRFLISTVAGEEIVFFKCSEQGVSSTPDAKS
jgi:hypothetical protein